MDVEYYKKQISLRDLKISTLENILHSYKKEKVANIKRINKLSKITSVLVNIDDDDILHIMIDGKFDIKLNQSYLSEYRGFCYICLTDDATLSKFTCNHGICNKCLIKNLYNDVNKR